MRYFSSLFFIFNLCLCIEFDDLHTYPKFKVEISKEFIIDSALENLKSQYVGSSVIMYGGEIPYFCILPLQSHNTLEDDESFSIPLSSDGNEEEARKAMQTLKGLKCLHLTQGWWTYEYCHLSHLRQYHQKVVAVDGKLDIRTSENSDYVLGRFEETFVSEINDSVKGKVITIKIGGGSKCDLTGNPRDLEIHISCPLNGIDERILSIAEVSTCSYVLAISTPRVCHLKGFQRKELHDMKIIDCKEIITESESERRALLKQKKSESPLKKPYDGKPLTDDLESVFKQMGIINPKPIQVDEHFLKKVIFGEEENQEDEEKNKLESHVSVEELKALLERLDKIGITKNNEDDDENKLNNNNNKKTP
jgi:hypothetical protein